MDRLVSGSRRSFSVRQRIAGTQKAADQFRGCKVAVATLATNEDVAAHHVFGLPVDALERGRAIGAERLTGPHHLRNDVIRDFAILEFVVALHSRLVSVDESACRGHPTGWMRWNWRW